MHEAAVKVSGLLDTHALAHICILSPVASFRDLLCVHQSCLPTTQPHIPRLCPWLPLPSQDCQILCKGLITENVGNICSTLTQCSVPFHPEPYPLSFPELLDSQLLFQSPSAMRWSSSLDWSTGPLPGMTQWKEEETLGKQHFPLFSLLLCFCSEKRRLFLSFAWCYNWLLWRRMPLLSVFQFSS